MVIVSAAAGNPSITAVNVTERVEVSKIALDDSIWQDIKAVDIALYPQRTIRLNDKKANALNADNRGKLIKVAAIYNSNGIAFRIQWKDDTRNVQSGMQSDLYPDGFAVQLATKFDEPQKLPYIGMGSEGRPVLVYLHKAVKAYNTSKEERERAPDANEAKRNTLDENLTRLDANAGKSDVFDYKKVFISEGFGSMTEIRDSNHTFETDMTYTAGGWTAVFGRGLKGEYADLSRAGAFPVAFALWDGAKMGRADIKHLSSWIAVKPKERKGGEALVAELTAAPKGDAVVGEVLVASYCSSCHTLGDKKAVAPYLAPDMSMIGGYSTVAYLRESIVEPSAVVVPGYNRNAHKNYPWYGVDENGTRVSVMPQIWDGSTEGNRTDDDIDDAVAYLWTLKTKIEK